MWRSIFLLRYKNTGFFLFAYTHAHHTHTTFTNKYRCVFRPLQWEPRESHCALWGQGLLCLHGECDTGWATFWAHEGLECSSFSYKHQICLRVMVGIATMIEFWARGIIYTVYQSLGLKYIPIWVLLGCVCLLIFFLKCSNFNNYSK